MERYVCNLCHSSIGEHETTYHYARNNGKVEQYHMPCWKETTQGSLGYKPLKVTVNGMEVEPRKL